MWKGSVAFGLVHVPIKMYSATEDHSIRFHQVHAEDGGRIQMKRVCSVCGETIAYADIGKAYDAADGQRILITKDDLAGLPVGPDKEIEVLQFAPSDQIDPVMLSRTYYLEPDERAAKPYVLLREALLSTHRTAIVKIAIRQRTQLAALRVRDGVIVLQMMLWPDEIREADFDFLEAEADIRPQELQMAESLISNLSSDFDPQDYSDDYREAMLQRIDDKLQGGQGFTPAAQEGDIAGSDAVVDLMTALRASVDRTSSTGERDVPSQRSATSRTTADEARKSPAS